MSVDKCTYMYMNDDYLISLKSCREKAGLTQKEVETLLGLRDLMMRDYEIGRLKLPVQVAMRLSELYQVSLDELLSSSYYQSKSEQLKVLNNFTALFLGNGFGVMYMDPIIRGFLEGRAEQLFSHSLFELLCEDLGQRHKKELALEISKMLFSLASVDGKISDEEIACVRYLLNGFELQSKYKEISVLVREPYLPQMDDKGLTRIEMRHFIIWLLFFFACADRTLNEREIGYIEKCAEHLKVNRTNFLFIKEKFTKRNM